MAESPRYRDFIRPNPRRELEDELQFHLETEIEELIAAGRSPAEARQEALARLAMSTDSSPSAASDRKRLGRRRRARFLDVVRQDFVMRCADHCAGIRSSSSPRLSDSC